MLVRTVLLLFVVLWSGRAEAQGAPATADGHWLSGLAERPMALAVVRARLAAAGEQLRCPAPPGTVIGGAPATGLVCAASSWARADEGLFVSNFAVDTRRGDSTVIAIRITAFPPRDGGAGVTHWAALRRIANDAFGVSACSGLPCEWTTSRGQAVMQRRGLGDAVALTLLYRTPGKS